MAVRGKKSVASMAVASPVGVDNRLAPPFHLTPAQKAEWVQIVNARPADWFGPEHAAMLVQYCRHKVLSDLIAQQVEEFEPEWLLEDEGLKRFDKLGAMLERETRAMNALLRSMRLTQQSLVRADKAVATQKGRKPWQSNDD
ncbi:hypothetical protein [Pseudomonas kurunegalensis]|uniref:hypothetical protein n=1 Tax=Pseudomonas kurunegalensis TaxID=485880 RepID=UPI002117D634|nr:hypothetical protein [Pseudomonas kurunegalensis]